MNTARDIVQAMIDDAPLVEPISDLKSPPNEQEKNADRGSFSWPAPLDIRSLLSKPAEPPRMISEGFPCGYATLTAGHGGSGKSSIELRRAMCIATGRPWFGLECEQRPVLYLSAEDRADVLHWRLQRICDHEGISPYQLDGLHIVDLVGHDAILFRRHPQHGPMLTPAFAELERMMAETGANVLFVDGVSDTFGGNENDRAEVKQYVNALVRLVGDDGAVMLIHHVSKPTAAAGTSTEGYSGSTGWHNSVRARWYLHPEVERTDDGITPTGALILALQKSNLGASDQSIKLRWNDDAHLFVAESGISRFDRKLQETTEQRGIVDAIREVIARGDYVPAAAQGPRTALHVLSATNRFPESLKSRSARGRFWRHIERLRANSTLREGEIYARHRRKVATLELQTGEESSNA